MWLARLSLVLFSLTSCTQKNTSYKKHKFFTFNLPREISSLDPLLLRGTAKRFVLFNLHRGLYFYDNENKLTPHGASSCKSMNTLIIKCKLLPKKWSDGSLITSQHYLNTYKTIKNQKEEGLEVLSNIKKVESNNSDELTFFLISPEKEFVHRLSDIRWAPRKEERLYPENSWKEFSGPYTVSAFLESSIELESNKFYDDFLRPHVKGVFVDDPSAALNLYSTDKIDFLRYLETSNAPKYPKRYLTPFARLDGVFFNPKHLKDLSFRKALFHSLDFKELQKIFSSPSLPGCSSLPSFFFKNKVKCYAFDLKKAQNFMTKSLNAPKSLTVYVPSINSNEHLKLSQWLKESWRKNLNLNVKISQLESGVFYENVKLQKLGVYRKAISLSNLTCSEAKKLVQTQPEFLEVSIPQNLLCDEFFSKIHEMYIRLPLGMPSFAHLHSKSYSGYYINMLGQFGLERLKPLDKKGDL